MTSSNRPTPRNMLLALLLPSLLAVLAYMPIWDAGFAFDDPVAIQSNPLINGQAPVGDTFTRNFWGDQRTYEHVASWRPLTVLSLRAQHGIGGGEARTYHATNLLWLLALVALVWWAGSTTGLPPPLVGAAGAFMALTGANSEAVASIVGQGDLMACALAMAGAVALFLRTGPRWTVIGVLALGLALLSKETAVLLVVPAAIVTASQRRWRATVSVLGLLVVWYAARAAAVGHLGGDVPAGDNPLVLAGLGERLMSGLGIVGRYASWTVFGRPPAADYTAAVELGLLPYVLLGITAVAVSGWLALKHRDNPLALLGAMILVVAAVVLSNLLTLLPVPIAGRYGPWWAAGVCFVALGVAGKREMLFRPVTIGLALGALAGLPTAVMVSDAWADDTALFAFSVEQEPDSAKAWVNLGAAHHRGKRLDEAKAAYEAALRLTPTSYQALYRLANVERDHGKNLRRAYELGTRALKHATTDSRGAKLSLCATALAGGGPRRHARDVLTFCEAAVAGNDSVKARLLHARAIQASGKLREAQQAFEALLADHRGSDDAKGHYIGLLAQTRQIARAIALQREMLAASPDDEVRKRNMVALLFMRADHELMSKQPARACETAREAERLVSAKPVREQLIKFCGPTP